MKRAREKTPPAPLILPRWVLQVKYAGFVVFAAAVVWASSPTVFDILGSETSLWAIGVGIAAAVSLPASRRPEWEPVERWSVSALACLMLIYALSPIAFVLAGDSDRAAFAVIAFMLGILPGFRAFQLLRGIGLSRGPIIPALRSLWARLSKGRRK